MELRRSYGGMELINSLPVQLFKCWQSRDQGSRHHAFMRESNAYFLSSCSKDCSRAVSSVRCFPPR